MCERMNDMIIQIEGLGSIHIGDNGLDGVSHDDRGRPILHLVLTLNSPSRDAHPEDGGIGFTFISAGANHDSYHQVYEDQLPLAKRILHALRQSSLETITVRRVVLDLLEEHQVESPQILRQHQGRRPGSRALSHRPGDQQRLQAVPASS